MEIVCFLIFITGCFGFHRNDPDYNVLPSRPDIRTMYGRPQLPLGKEGVNPSSLIDWEEKISKAGKWPEFIAKLQKTSEKLNGRTIMPNWEEDALKMAAWVNKISNDERTDDDDVEIKTQTIVRPIVRVRGAELQNSDSPHPGMEAYWPEKDEPESTPTPPLKEIEKKENRVKNIYLIVLVHHTGTRRFYGPELSYPTPPQSFMPNSNRKHTPIVEKPISGQEMFDMAMGKLKDIEESEETLPGIEDDDTEDDIEPKSSEGGRRTPEGGLGQAPSPPGPVIPYQPNMNPGTPAPMQPRSNDYGGSNGVPHYYDEKAMPDGGAPRNGMPPMGMPPGGMPSYGMQQGGMPPGRMPSYGMQQGGMPPRGIPSYGMQEGGMPPGRMPSYGMQKGGMPSRVIPSYGMQQGGMPPGGMPSYGMQQVGMPPGRMPSYGMQKGGMPPGRMPSYGMQQNGPSGGMPSYGMQQGGTQSGGMPSYGMQQGAMPSNGMPGSGMPPNGSPSGRYGNQGDAPKDYDSQRERVPPPSISGPPSGMSPGSALSEKMPPGPNGPPGRPPSYEDYGPPPNGPGGMPPNEMPPNGMPPNGMPPNGMPPNGMPPNGMIPNGMPQDSVSQNMMLPNVLPLNEQQNGMRPFGIPSGMPQQSKAHNWMGQPSASYGHGEGQYAQLPSQLMQRMPQQTNAGEEAPSVSPSTETKPTEASKPAVNKIKKRKKSTKNRKRPKPTPKPEEELVKDLPKFDDFNSPIKWVKFNSKDTLDGLAKVTDPETGTNRQYELEGTIYVPIVDLNPERIGFTTPRSKSQTFSTEKTILRTVLKSMGDMKAANERDWLTVETILRNGNNSNNIETCESDSCPARCQGVSCDTRCIGPGCTATCKGEGCLAMCIGESCVSRCDGMSCDSRCRGKSCDAPCLRFSCVGTVNGASQHGGGTWEEWYGNQERREDSGRNQFNIEKEQYYRHEARADYNHDEY